MNKDARKEVVVAINRLMVLALTDKHFDIFVSWAPHVQLLSVRMYSGHFSDGDDGLWWEDCYLDWPDPLKRLRGD